MMSIVILTIFSSSSFAVDATTGAMIPDVSNQFLKAAATWETRAMEIGKWIFLTLAVLELTWAAALWSMEKDSPSSLMVALVRKMMVLGFFYTFLIQAPTWIPAIVNSLQQSGAYIGGHTVASVTPLTIVEHGINVVKSIWKVFSDSEEFGSLSTIGISIIMGFLLIFVTIAIMLSFIFIAIEYTITVIESYIVMGMGLMLMGFSGSQWTRDFSQKYIGYAFSVGIKLMVLMLLLSLIMTITSTWNADLTAALNGKKMNDWVQPMLMIAGSSILIGLLAIKIPSLASSLLSGAPSLGGAAAVGAAAGAAAGVAGLAAGGSKILGAGAKAAGAVGGAATKGIAAAAVGATGMAQAAGAASNLATASGFTPGSAVHAGAAAGHMVAGLGGMAGAGLKNVSDKAGAALDGATKQAGEKWNNAVSNSIGGKLASSLDEKAVDKLSASESQSGEQAGASDNTSSSSSGASASSVPPPSQPPQASSPDKTKPPTVSPPRNPNPQKGSFKEQLKKAVQQLPLDHGAVAAAAPKLDHHEP